MKQFVNVSGGKDSTAMWLLAIERGEAVEACFADTGHEHPLTYEYIDYLESKLGPIRRVQADFTRLLGVKRNTVQTKWREEGVSEDIIEEALSVLNPTGNPYLDMCLYHGRFPSTKAKFCTQELKVIPIVTQVYGPVLSAGDEVLSWQAVRRDESRGRAKLDEYEDTFEYGYIYRVYRPILDWTVEDVFAMHAKHGLEPNPLYKLGMGRVGCMPCINARKEELYHIASRFPDQIDRVARWEALVAKAHKRRDIIPTLFATAEGKGVGVAEVAEWSKTKRGGRQYDLFRQGDVPMCHSIYGLCE